MKEQNTIYKMMKKFTVFLVLKHIFKYAIRMLENKHQAKTFVIHAQIPKQTCFCKVITK